MISRGVGIPVSGDGSTYPSAGESTESSDKAGCCIPLTRWNHSGDFGGREGIWLEVSEKIDRVV